MPAESFACCREADERKDARALTASLLGLPIAERQTAAGLHSHPAAALAAEGSAPPPMLVSLTPDSAPPHLRHF